MPNINKVIISGNLVRDPDARILENGTHLAKMSIANNQRYRDRNGEWQEKTCYVNVIAWRKTAELVGEFCRKGSPVMVEGELVYNSWEDRDGNQRSRLEVNARRIQFLERRSQDSSYQDHTHEQNRTNSSEGDEPTRPEPVPPDDDIPF
ncbi:MAG: single-stranded DNA-binding protein [Candidatus Fermentibacteraceae bacterium]|nr:single-stranded DNA-binding protein [Candidatus Fermentibacteraceae bacterium]